MHPRKIYLICPVRNVTADQQRAVDTYAHQLTERGDDVHNPRYAVDQTDTTGVGICLAHFDAMDLADEVHVFWDATSTGSHFDLGMAFALDKPVVVVELLTPDSDAKSYAKVAAALRRGREGTRP